MKEKISEETWNAVAEVQEQYWRIMEDPEMSAIADLREKAIMDRKFLIAYAEKQAEERGLEKGMQKGMQKGIKEGMKEGMKKVAKKLKKEKVDIDIIEKTTGLTRKEIEEL